MKRFEFLCVVMLAALCCVSTGCGPKRPDGMPQVEPFVVKVVDGSKPIADVEVFFIHDGNTSVVGHTDANGVAEMKTVLQNYSEKGVPTGDYRVTCTKDPMVDHWKTPQERAEMNPGEAAAYAKEWQAKCDELPREIPKIWKDFDKTPLTASVAAGGGEVTFDVEGKAND